jgi:hypothetical protein
MDDANEVEVEVVQDIRRPALCIFGEYRNAVPKCNTSGSRLPSGALKRNLPRTPK